MGGKHLRDAHTNTHTSDRTRSRLRRPQADRQEEHKQSKYCLLIASQHHVHVKMRGRNRGAHEGARGRAEEREGDECAAGGMRHWALINLRAKNEDTRRLPSEATHTQEAEQYKQQCARRSRIQTPPP